MKELANIYDFDDELKSDWYDIIEMFFDIRKHIVSSQEKIFNADDSGQNYIPPRSPRIGFFSKSKKWTIKLSKAKSSDENLNRLLRSPAGRQELLDWLNKC